MSGRLPERHIRWPVMRQRWDDVAFIHWSCPPEVVAGHLPPGFEVDTYDGRAWVGLTPFRVGACAFGPLPPPRVWAFPETDLRTYVLGPDGRDGLWFLDMEAQSIPVVAGARTLLGAPHRWAVMSVRREVDEVRYRSRRWHATGEAGHDICVRLGDPLDDGGRAGLVDWLTGRWGAWTTHAGLALWSPVIHQPWPLRSAEVVTLDETLFAAAGMARPQDPPLVHFSPGVDARFGVSHPHLAPALRRPPVA